MNDICLYTISIRGQVDLDEINAMSPLQMTAGTPLTAPEGSTGWTHFSVCTDQSGMIGLMRHLHGLGLVFLSVQREERLE